MFFKKSYRGLWEKQNIELDELTLKYNKLEEAKNKEIDNLKRELNLVKQTLDSKSEIISEQKRAIDLVKGYKEICENKLDEISNDYISSCEALVKEIINNHNIKEKSLVTSKGGLTKQVNKLTLELNNLKNENDNLRQLIRRMQYEQNIKLTSTTIEELINYKLFVNKGGKRK